MKRSIISLILAASMATLTGCKSFNPTPEQITAVGNLALTAAQIAAMYRDDDVYRVAICVGIYKGSVYGTCLGADVDAIQDAELLKAIGYNDVRLILNEQATRQHIIDTTYAACANLKAGDILYVKGSSHGGQQLNPAEDDGKDEYFCAADGPLVDNDIWRLLCQVPPGVRVVLAFDTCNSGSMYRAHDYAAAVQSRVLSEPVISCYYRNAETFRGSLLYIGGCADGQLSWGDATGGTLSKVMRATAPRASTYDHWCHLIRAAMPPEQIPVITEVQQSFGHLPPLY
ncbi:MAG: caspase family protein [Kiritimatiellae bacterium]|nr:caspase family protein [Kiritimatiellia bacterium]